MKTLTILLATLGFALASAQAQSPLFINYQGKVTSATGVPLGSTGTAPNFTAAPLNRKVIFRIWDSPTSTLPINRLWSEQQTVTISLGEFSVLLGQGIDAVYNSVTETPLKSATPLDTVFTSVGTGRFLEIVVDDGDNVLNTTDVPITPRQQITSTAYSFRAKSADTAVSALNVAQTSGNATFSSATFTNATVNAGTFNGIVNSTGGSFSGTTTGGTFNNNTFTNGTFTNGTFSGNGAGLTSLAAANVVGVLGTAQIPSLDAGKITTGAFAVARIPSLDATQITTGTFADGRLSSNVALLNTLQTFTGEKRFTSINGINVSNGFTSGSVTTAGIELRSGAAYIDFTVDGSGADYNMRIINNGTNQLDFLVGKAAFANDLSALGNVIIGNSAANNGKGRLVVSDAAGSYSFTGGSIMDSGSPRGGAGALGASSMAIYAGGIISANAFFAFSDERIKNVKGLSDGATDLQTLLTLRVTDYVYKDTIAKGSGAQKMLIAQQVEQVFPQAVTRTTSEVPDIYQKAATKDGWVTLLTTLKKGERVRLIAAESDGVHEVLEVDADGGRFRTAFLPKASEVFVYGREVNDFRSVDYNAIAMLNVSATQQVKKEKDAEIKALNERVAALQEELQTIKKLSTEQAARVTALEAGDKTRESRVSALERLLITPGSPSIQTAALPAHGEK